MDIEEIRRHEEYIVAKESLVAVKRIQFIDDVTFSINNLIPIKIDALSSLYEYGAEIEVIDEDGVWIGSICTPPKDFTIPLEKFTAARYVAYIADSSYGDFLSDNYVQKACYIIVDADRFEDYKLLAKTSSVWGGYHHSSGLECHRKEVSQITARRNLVYPTSIHIENSINAVVQPFAFERFLKKYHQIELLSDFDIVERIKQLDQDLYGIGELFSEIDSNELNRIGIILGKRITDIQDIVLAFEHVKSFKSKAYQIFQKYKKKGNPFSDEREFNKFLDLPDFSESTLKNHFRKNLENQAYVDFILKVAGFWIYRVRCSIAHKRIGEYVMSPQDENFIVDFCEPLMDAIVIASFKQQE